jgi:hypothetical protein
MGVPSGECRRDPLNRAGFRLNSRAGGRNGGGLEPGADAGGQPNVFLVEDSLGQKKWEGQTRV